MSGPLLRALVRPVCRALPWRGPLLAGGVALALAASTRLPDRTPDEGSAHVLLRLAALLGAVGVGFLLDDPARHTTGSAPVGRAIRATVRMALALPVVAAWWAAAVLLVPAASRPPVVPVTVEAAAMAVCALAVATTTVRFTAEAEPGKRVALWLAAAALVVTPLPDRWGLLSLPGDQWWPATQVRWAVALAVTVGVCAAWTGESLSRRAR